MQWALNLAEQGWIPDPVVRQGIRRLLSERIAEIARQDASPQSLAEVMRQSPLAIATDTANEQHYEVPPGFFEAVLGKHLKYSCCYWPSGVSSLDQAEAVALAMTCERAGLEDGMEILELGCGWGSLTLWMAQHYPASRITAVSNSVPQGDFIRRQASERGLNNVRVLTADMNDFQAPRTPSGGAYDRVVSIEMFEHMRNYQLLLERVAEWLAPDGKLFVHIFCHRSRPYFFEDSGPGDWMARHFFTGGLMPSEDLLDQFSGPVVLDRRWRVNGRHYEKTALAWLENMDRQRERVEEILRPVYGADTDRWVRRWRIFFLACAELFGFNGGEEWFVSHSLWSRADSTVQ